VKLVARLVPFVKVQYQVSRRKPGCSKRVTETKTGLTLIVIGKWGDEETHDKVSSAIKKRHKGWSLVGYSLIKKVK